MKEVPEMKERTDELHDYELDNDVKRGSKKTTYARRGVRPRGLVQLPSKSWKWNSSKP